MWGDRSANTNYKTFLLNVLGGQQVPRLFISHASKDNIEALAFQRWLELKGWSKGDVFIDLHDMEAGERWRDTLVKANVACEALLFLVSKEALNSDECRRLKLHPHKTVILPTAQPAEFLGFELYAGPRKYAGRKAGRGQRRLPEANVARIPQPPARLA